MEDSFTLLLINLLLPQHKLPAIFILFSLLFSFLFLILSTTKSLISLWAGFKRCYIKCHQKH